MSTLSAPPPAGRGRPRPAGVSGWRGPGLFLAGYLLALLALIASLAWFA